MIQFDQEPFTVLAPIAVHDSTRTLWLHSWDRAKIAKWLRWNQDNVPSEPKSFNIGFFNEIEIGVIVYE